MYTGLRKRFPVHTYSNTTTIIRKNLLFDKIFNYSQRSIQSFSNFNSISNIIYYVHIPFFRKFSSKHAIFLSNFIQPCQNSNHFHHPPLFLYTSMKKSAEITVVKTVQSAPHCGFGLDHRYRQIKSVAKHKQE